MKSNINLELLENISEDIRKTSIVYDSLSFFYTTSRSNRGAVRALELSSIQNNDFYLLLHSYNYLGLDIGDLLYKLINNKKLNDIEKNALPLIRKVVKIKNNKSIIKDINNIIKDYIKDILSRNNPLLNKIYPNTKMNLKAYSFIGLKRIGGSAFKNTITLSVTPYIKQTNYYNKETKKYNPNKFYKIMTHEIIHTINRNNPVFKDLKKYIKKNAKYTEHSFSECFTSVIENVFNYNYKLTSKKWNTYYYKNSSLNKFEQRLEDKIRSLYDLWSNTNKEDTFLEYLYSNKEELIFS